MLFLVRREFKIPHNMPPDQLAALKVQTMTYVFEQMRDRKILAGGRVVHKPVTYFICDCDSAAEMQSMLADSPLAPFTKDEVTPLLSADENMERATRLLESLNAVGVPMGHQPASRPLVSG